MVKIEKLLDGARASIMLNGKAHPVYLAQTFADDVLASLIVHSGKIVYSINETEIVEVAAEKVMAKPEPAVVQSTAKVVQPAPRTPVKQVVKK